MPPNHPRSDRRNVKLITRLERWAEQNNSGWVFGCSAGFTLPNGAHRSPDAAWIPVDKIAALPQKQQDGFYHLTPDFLVEIRSTERLARCKRKMQEYMENGCELAWLIDPKNGTVTIYRQNQPPVELVRPKAVHGEGPVAGFVLDTTDIIDF